MPEAPESVCLVTLGKMAKCSRGSGETFVVLILRDDEAPPPKPEGGPGALAALHLTCEYGNPNARPLARRGRVRGRLVGGGPTTAIILGS
jgi:hypothetical protein